MDDRLLDLKKEYDEIEIPAELKSAVENGIKRGEKHMNSNKTTNIFVKTFAGVAAAFIVLMMTVNVSPVLAAAMEEVPLLGSLVKVLQFDHGQAGGGEITDSTDISDLDTFEKEGYENIVINFTQGDVGQENMGAYKITYSENPYTMTFEIGGARRFSAKDDFEKILQHENVDDIYQIITLDDSLIRFVIVFNNPVEYKVQEMEDPASLVVSVREDTEYTENKTYSLRTESYPYGETIGMIEENLMIHNVDRVLKDEDGLFFVEIESFDTKEQAEERLAQISKTSDIQLLVEERIGASTPISYPAENNTEETAEEADPSLGGKTLYPASITIGSNHYYGDIEILEDGLNVHGEDELLYHFQYKDIELTKLFGEASFILEIRTSDNLIKVSGVFAEFFEELEKYTEVK